MRHHDRRVQRLEIERRDRRVVRPFLRLEHGRTLVRFLGDRAVFDRRDHVPEFSRLLTQLGKHLDLLPALHQECQGDPGRLRHLQEVEQCTQFLHELVREEGILDAVLGNLPELRGVPLDEPREHLFCRHVDLLIAQVQFRDVVQ